MNELRRAVTYDHRLRRNGHPVRSAIRKFQIRSLVVDWVAISKYQLLYVFWGGRGIFLTIYVETVVAGRGAKP